MWCHWRDTCFGLNVGQADGAGKGLLDIDTAATSASDDSKVLRGPARGAANGSDGHTALTCRFRVPKHAVCTEWSAKLSGQGTAADKVDQADPDQQHRRVRGAVLRLYRLRGISLLGRRLGENKPCSLKGNLQRV